MEFNENQFGLVLAGGGGKGAYHIGVWKALDTFGFSRNIAGVSGTSVGALNTLLYANGDLELAVYVWNHISQKDILHFDKKQAAQYFPMLLIGTGALTMTYGMATMVVKALKNGVFSPTGVEELILRNVDLGHVSQSSLPLFAGCYAVNRRRMDYLRMDGSEPDKIKQIAMASSALPMIFPWQRMDGNTYLDGGIADNVPVKPLYDLGLRKFVVCHLSDEAKPGGFDKKFPDASFVEIIPQEKQGGVIGGLLDFSSEGAARRIEQGYYDVLEMLQNGGFCEQIML